MIKMQQFSYGITDKEGLHARPAGMLVKAASAFQSNIMVRRDEKEGAGGMGRRDGREVSARRLVAVMGLAVKCGDKITVTCEGPDELKAAKELENFLQNNL